jgi:hypothetical protein
MVGAQKEKAFRTFLVETCIVLYVAVKLIAKYLNERLHVALQM